MSTHPKGKTLLWIIFLLECFALPLQFYLLKESSGFTVLQSTVRFFSFFTILTNSIVAITSGMLLASRFTKLSSFFSKPSTLTAVTNYIFIVGLVYNIILRQLYYLEGLHHLVSEIFHTIVPLLFVLYWFIYVPKQSLSFRAIPAWLIYPLLYMVYTLVHGNYSGFYPYPFVDVNTIGLVKALGNGGIVLLVFVFTSLLMVWFGKKMK